MYCLLENNFLVSGPYPWNMRLFQADLQDEYGISYPLPIKPTEVTKFIINDSLKLLPVSREYNSSEFDASIHDRVGPYVEFEGEELVLRYDIIDKDVNSVRAVLKAVLASNRYNFETAGIIVNIQNQDILVPTDRENRNIFAQALALNIFNQQWKFGDVWLTLDEDSLKTVCTAIITHIQAAFDWEKMKISELDNAGTVAALNEISINRGE